MGKIFSFFEPDQHYKDLASVNFETLGQQGIKAVLVDMDNTLISHGRDIPDLYSLEQIRRIKEAGLECILFSNAKRHRIVSFSEKTGLDFILSPKKPSVKGIERFLSTRKDLNKRELVIIGDQIFTDILTGKSAGIETILVDPIDSSEPIWIRAKRRVEYFFRKRGAID